jgi:hypothetical protein
MFEGDTTGRHGGQAKVPKFLLVRFWRFIAVYENNPVRFKASGYRDLINEEWIEDHDVVRLIDLGSYSYGTVIHPQEGSHRRAAAFNAEGGERLAILLLQKGLIENLRNGF